MAKNDIKEWEDITTKLTSIKKIPDGVTQREWQTVVNRLGELKKRGSKPLDPKANKENTKSTLAKWFVLGYFILCGSSLIYVPLYNMLMHWFSPEAGYDVWSCTNGR